MPRALASLIGAALLALPASSSAQTPPDLRFTTAIDLPVTVGLFAGNQITQIAFKRALAPAAPRWDERAADGTDTLNAFDRAGLRLRWANPKEAARISDFLLFMSNISAIGTTGVAAAAGNDSRAHLGENIVMSFEAASVAVTVNHFTKYLVGRQRPCAHFAAPGEVLPCGEDRSDENLSFYSGHATVSAAMAVSSGTIASLRGYSLAPMVWTSGTLIALGTSYLRVAAGKHYLSDVLTGLAVGSAIGALVPLLAHGRVDAGSASSMSAAPPLGGASFSWGGVF